MEQLSLTRVYHVVKSHDESPHLLTARPHPGRLLRSGDLVVSVVLTTDGVQRMVLNLVSYIQQFWAFLGDKQIKPALALPDWIQDSEQKTERERMFFEWISETRRKSPIFTRRWKYHFFELDGRSQMMDDWLPPISYASVGAPGYALPQTPQTRRRIPDPFDPHGRKRSIRVHLKGKLPTR